MSQTHEMKLEIDAKQPRLADAGSAADFISLMKPRVMSLVVFTALIGLVMAPVSLHPVVAVSAVILIAIGAGAAAALNMWYDADIDAVMTRTKTRPVPAGRIDQEEALIFGLWLSGLSVLSMAVLINYTSAALLAFTIFFYAVIYTILLKRRTAQNIVIGGAAGAFPPVIGWVAATGSFSIEPLLFFLIIFIWTPPHFWALALVKNDDYSAANIPMLPVTRGADATVRQIMLYTVLLAGAVMLPYILGFAGILYGVGASVASAIFVGLSILLIMSSREQRDRIASMLFGYSIFYLFIVFALLPADRLMALST
tara:strand:+ start:425 stop:1360 length:936 start_codon:yes stop_codon:yes gene_type:complete